jgi:diamine N-acetyltransferase
MDITVEFKKDAETIARLNQHVHQPHHQRQPGIFKPYDFETALAVVTELLAKDNAHGLIAYLDGEAAGYAIVLRRDYPPPFFQEGHRSLFIDQMAVKAGCQGRGVGERLMAAIADLARSEGVGRIELNVWEDNQGARKFYARCGFVTYTRNMYRDV